MHKSKSLFLSFLFIIINLSAQEKGSFIISTTPQNATISLEEFPDIQKNSPAQFVDYKPLKYKVKISKDNYHDVYTLVTCYADSTMEYHFDLTPKTGSVSIQSNPYKAIVYLDNQLIGYTPVNNYPISWGKHHIRIAYNDYDDYNNTFVINEDTTHTITHDFTDFNLDNYEDDKPLITDKPDPFYFEKPYVQETNSDGNEEMDDKAKFGFGSVGMFAILGSNGAKGTTWRYGADIGHFLRLYGESNTQSNITGFGLDFIAPADFGGVAIYGKVGGMARTYDGGYNGDIVTTFLIIGGGIGIKPIPHFQVFGEFDINIYDQEQHPDDIQAWKDQFPGYSPVTGWLGMRVAF
nr:PEGA domain-containing protein [uncultured Carboxylicivirga sp.]